MALQLFDRVVLIECNDARMSAFIRELWGPFEVEEADPASSTIQISRDGERWELRSFDGQVQDLAHPWYVVLALRNEVDRFALASVPGGIDLHAATAQIEQRTILFPGAPGAGKTTLVLAGLRSGWKLVADDLTLLHESDLTIAVLPRPIGLRSRARWDAEWWSPPAWVGSSGGATLVPASVFALAHGPELSADGIVFPTFSQGAPTVIEPISSADALARLASHVRPLVPRVVSALSTMSGAVPAFALRYGDAEAAAECVTETFRTPSG